MIKKLIFVVALICLTLGCAPTKEIVQPTTRPKKIELKIANFFPPPAKQSKILDEFCKTLEERSDGRIKVRYYTGGSLLRGPAMYKGIESGIADIGYSHVYYTPGRMPVTEAVGLPLGYPSAWVGSKVANDFYNEFKPKEWNNVKVLWFDAVGPSLLISKKSIRKLEDLRGLTIRAPGVPGEIIKALGGKPAPTPMIETYGAIAKGVNDGVWAPYETLRIFRFAEVAKYSTVCWQVSNFFPFYLVMNKKSYNKLPSDIKEIFDELCDEYNEKFALIWNKVDIEGNEFGTKRGVEYIELSPEEVARWKKAVEPVIENYIKNLVNKGHSESEVRGWIKFLRDRIEYWTKKQIEIGIKSPTGPPEMRP